MRMYASVIVDIAHSNIDKAFSYEVPEDVNVVGGHRVLVPFGAGNRQTEGFVVSVSDKPPQDGTRLKSIIRTLEPYPVLLEDQIKLAKWIHKSYHCLFVDALRLMIPAQLRGGRVHEKTVRTVEINKAMTPDEIRAMLLTKSGKVRSRLQSEVVELLMRVGSEMSTADIQGFVPGSAGAIKALIDKGILTEHGRVVFRSPFRYEAKTEERPTLTSAQQHALDTICGGIEQGGGVFLLHGVTGSGKTEVYMSAISRAIEDGGSAIVLVPEISLTPQTVNRFRSRFGDNVAVLHSRLSSGERYDEWRRIRLGYVKVVVGARSALFAPTENLRAVIIDEEHEPSYQSEITPRYNSVEAAVKRCALTGATLVLGSATPSLFDYYRAKRGRFTLIEMPERISNIPMPRVEIADMRAEFMNGNTSIFSNALYDALNKCLKNGEQAILFVNRRGYSTFVSCRGCGYVFSCGECDVSMTYHKSENLLKCHYCGRSEPLGDVCPQCGKPYIKYFGIGTQQVEEQFAKYFPGYKSLRMDMDTTSVKNAHENILGAFERHEADVLIGTQMVAKGLDIPNVTLVGVIAADAMLHIPDFRSCERTFQLVTQVAGRAGRKEKQGTVIVQTYSPGHPAIQFASEHDYKGFYEYEIAQRRAALFPPYSIFIRALFCSSDEQSLEMISQRYEEGVREVIEEALRTHGGDVRELLLALASPAPVKKRQGLFRYQVLIKTVRTKNTSAVINAVYDYTDAHRCAELAALEVNPTDMF